MSESPQTPFHGPSFDRHRETERKGDAKRDIFDRWATHRAHGLRKEDEPGRLVCAKTWELD